MHGEQGVQLVDKAAVATHQADQVGRCLRYVERIIPGISFDKTLSVCTQQVDVFLPASVFIAGTGKTQARLEYVLIG